MKTAVNSISSYLQNWHHIPDEHEETMANGLTGGSTVGALKLCDGIMLEVALEPAPAFRDTGSRSSLECPYQRTWRRGA